ncbi:MAG: flagellar basal body P-ring formation chaperone FlgA [Candidatus Solibacter sp.]
MMPLAAFALAGCLAIHPGSDRILAGDLAASLPEWAALPVDTPLAPAPAPGVQRVLRAPELRRLAEHWKLAVAPDREVCVTRPAAVIDAARMLDAMRKELPDAQIEILDTSRMPAPEGELVFPLARLRQTAAGGYWHGYVRYAGNQHFSLWARVKVRVSVTRLFAVETLAAGVPVQAAQVRTETSQENPAVGFASEMREVAERVPRRTIAAGTVLRAEWFDAPKAVKRGDAVRVEVTQGGARLKLEGIAQASGSVGDTIAVENPTSRQRFTARIAGRGLVEVKGTL